MTVYAQRFWPNLPFRQANQMLMADQIERFWLITKLSRSRWWMRTDRPTEPCRSQQSLCDQPPDLPSAQAQKIRDLIDGHEWRGIGA
jgi:hypothetical protein